MVVDMAIHEPSSRLSERERLRLLRTFDEVVPRIPLRSLRSMENELSTLRRARRASGRRSLAERGIA
jgi:hypothetical protein